MKAYRYQLNGCALTTHDLVDAVASTIGSGCEYLIIEGAKGRNDILYSFVLRPELVGLGPVSSLLKEVS